MNGSAKPARLVLTGDRVLDDAQRSARESAQRLNRDKVGAGVLLDAEVDQPAGTGLAFTGGTARTFAHGLGRKAVGCIEVYGPDVAAGAHVGIYTSAIPGGLSSDTHIAVTPTNTGRCLLFVF